MKIDLKKTAETASTIEIFYEINKKIKRKDSLEKESLFFRGVRMNIQAFSSYKLSHPTSFLILLAASIINQCRDSTMSEIDFR